MTEPITRSLEGPATCQWRECQEAAGPAVPYGVQLAPHLQSAPVPAPSTVAPEPMTPRAMAGAQLQVRLCEAHAETWAGMEHTATDVTPAWDGLAETPLD